MTSCTVRPVANPAELAAAAALMREYRDSINTPLDFQNFDEENASLPGVYAPPRGCILVAWQAVGEPERERAVGVIALRPLPNAPGPDICEMKRMFVRPASQGRGVGAMLGHSLIAFAKAAGYRVMKLDTSADMLPAQRLYASLGFTPCERYNDDPHDDTLYFELRL